MIILRIFCEHFAEILQKLCEYFLIILLDYKKSDREETEKKEHFLIKISLLRKFCENFLPNIFSCLKSTNGTFPSNNRAWERDLSFT